MAKTLYDILTVEQAVAVLSSVYYSDAPFEAAWRALREDRAGKIHNAKFWRDVQDNLKVIFNHIEIDGNGRH